MRDDLKEAVIDAARDYLLGCGGTGRLRHALTAYETAALDEAGMPMLAAGMVRADGLPPLTEMQQAEPFHECLSDAVNGGLSVMRITPSHAVAALATSQEKAEPVALRKTFEEWLGEVVADGGCTVEALLVGDTDPIRCARSAWDACVASLYAAPVAAQASEPVKPSGYAYRYPDAFGGGTVIRFNGGQEVNGSRPIEAIPYWFNAPQPSAEAVRDAALEEEIDRLRHKAFMTNSDADKQEYYEAASKWFQDRHIRALKSAPPQPAEQPSASPSELFESGYALTDEEIAKLAESMPGGLEGFLRGWGWQNFARAVESEVMLAIASAQGEQE